MVLIRRPQAHHLHLLLLILNVLRQAVVPGKFENEVRLVDLRVLVEGDQLVYQVALNLLKNVRLI